MSSIIMPNKTFTVTSSDAGLTLAAFLRRQLPDRSWTAIRRLIETRHVRLNGDLCLDSARRLKSNDQLELLSQSAPPLPRYDRLVLRHVDNAVVVVEKPSGLNTVRHPAERDWSERRKELTPTLEDLVIRRLARLEGQGRALYRPRLRVAHRLDKETSGLVVFARTVQAERALGRQFHAHTVHRKYLAIVRGYPEPQRIESYLVRDRGDGRRGSTSLPGVGKIAVTYIDVLERLEGYTLLSCRLETGRTHQIRIHLAELGHPVCGDRVYLRNVRGEVMVDRSGAPRLALHAAELGFRHPETGAVMHWEMALPRDLADFLNRLRKGKDRSAENVP